MNTLQWLRNSWIIKKQDLIDMRIDWQKNPDDLTKSELEKIASFLNITVEELLQYT